MSTKTLTLDLRGGERLQRKLQSIVDSLAGGAGVKVGFLDKAKYPDGTPVASVALWQEFGTPAAPHPTPARPFFRTMIAQKSPGWGKAIAKIAPTVDYDSRKVMALMGEGMKGQLQHSINEWSDPPNAPSTADAKGFNKPLIDTALMLRSVDYEVVTRGS